jgi:hypothetical protein
MHLLASIGREGVVLVRVELRFDHQPAEATEARETFDRRRFHAASAAAEWMPIAGEISTRLAGTGVAPPPVQSG